MAWINIDYKDIAASIKIIAFGFILIMPILFLDLVLFTKHFYQAYPLYVVIVATYCITIAVILNFVMMMFCMVGPDNSVEKILLFGIGIATAFLLNITAVAYEGKWDFHTLTRYTFAIPLSVSIISILYWERKKYISKRQNKNQAKGQKT